MIMTVVIIGILAGVTLNVVNIKRVQQRSRDSRRIGDIKRIQTALELYFADTRSYPQSTSWVNIGSSGNPVAAALIPSYMDRMPADPYSGTQSTDPLMICHATREHGYYYISNDTGGKYVLNAIMETTENAKDNLCNPLPNCQTGSGVNCGTNATYCYCVQNPM